MYLSIKLSVRIKCTQLHSIRQLKQVLCVTEMNTMLPLYLITHHHLSGYVTWKVTKYPSIVSSHRVETVRVTGMLPHLSPFFKEANPAISLRVRVRVTLWGKAGFTHLTEPHKEQFWGSLSCLRILPPKGSRNSNRQPSNHKSTSSTHWAAATPQVLYQFKFKVLYLSI